MQQEITNENRTRGGRSPGDGMQFQDSQGTVWRVSERERIGHDMRTVRMLVFESSMAIRCVRDYPDDWPGMAPEALEYLSWRV